uniref:Serine-threonine/tyrosine-protein kinase catalytic domain-containing protein n=1 Tax=Acrobeloides nanus TaxID=290746 RepID=A0A914CNW0_9BILA
MTREDVLAFLLEENRLKKPSNMNESLYEIMLDCWNPAPESRPNFENLEKKFRAFIEVRNEMYGYVEASST